MRIRSAVVVEMKQKWVKILKEKVGVEEAKVLLQIELLGPVQKLEEYWTYPDFAGIFVWVDTPQGHKYWSEIYNKIIR